MRGGDRCESFGKMYREFFDEPAFDARKFPPKAVGVASTMTNLEYYSCDTPATVHGSLRSIFS
jgi:hypothetical protein